MDVHPRPVAARTRSAPTPSGRSRPVAEQKGLEFRRRARPALAGQTRRHRRAAAAAGAAQPALQRLQVHRRRARWRCASTRRPTERLHRRRRRAAAERLAAFTVLDTGIGIAAGQAGADLRGLPAGRRHHQPALRRHGPRPLHLARDRAAARRRAARGERAAARAAPSRCCCRSRPPPARRTSRRPGPPGALAPARRAAPPAESPRAGGRPCSRCPTSSATTARASGRATACCWWWRTTAPSRASCSRRRAAAASACSARPPARRRWPSRWSTGPRRSCSTSGCPTSTAWCCSSTSSGIPTRATSPCRWSSAGGRRRDAWRAGAVGYVREAAGRTTRCDAHAGGPRALRRARGRARCWWSRTTTAERDALAELLGGDDVEIARPRPRADGGARRRCASGASTASCSTSGLPEGGAVRAAGGDERGRAPSPTCRSSSTPARPHAQGGDAAQAVRARRSW